MDKSTKAKFIWPDSNFSISSIFKYSNPNTIEKEIKDLYPNVFPVLFSSARAGIVNLLIHLKATKLTKVWTPSYSSHCVLEAISRIGFPTPEFENSNIALVYHQWGYYQKVSFQNQIIIEDSADSFFLPGNIIFPNDGDFQLLSLPKSLGCLGGGILLCKSEHDAQMIRLIRNSKSKFVNQQFILKLLGQFNNQLYNYWDSYESAFGYPSKILCSDILNKLIKIHAYEKRVKSNIKMFEESNTIFKFDHLPSDRLPCVIPLIDYKLFQTGITSFVKEFRMFNTTRNYNHVNFEKVLPIPVHIDIDESYIENFLKNV